MKIKEARKKIIGDLEKNGFVKEKKPITHVVNVHDKCGTEIEFIPTSQWFVKIIDNKKLWASQGEKIKWFPEHMKKRYDNWIDGLQWDWNISRDRHFGVPIPVWQCSKCGEVITPDYKELPLDPTEKTRQCKKCKIEAKGEDKVLDTWATSSLTPEIVSSLLKGNVKTPFSLRPQAHDIIRTWAFYTIVRSYFNDKQIPWKDITISGNVSLHGEKMSKSKGNVVDPKNVIEKYGADALRFWAAGSKLGEDLDYNESDLIAGKKFINKLINASNFVFMNLKDYDGKSRPRSLKLLDDNFMKKLMITSRKITESFESYNYSAAKLVLEQFFWQDFCDNYLEIVKKRIYQGEKEERLSAQYTLYNSLLYITKMIAPIMPFVTEYVYQEHFRKYEKKKSIHIIKWPEFLNISYTKENIFTVFVNILGKIRKEKTNSKRPMNSEIILTLEKGFFKRLEPALEDLKNVTGAKEIKTGNFKVEFV